MRGALLRLRNMKGTLLAASLLLSALLAPGLAGGEPGPAGPAAVEHGPRGRMRLALTFDACATRDPDPYDPRVAAVLAARRVPATVFVSGGWVREEPGALAELAANPLLEIGNHAFTHPHLTRLPDADVRAELARTQSEIAARTGRPPVLFRPPYGEYDARVVRIAAGLGLTTVEYDLPSGDPDARADRRALVEWVLRRARPGSIVVMHLNHRRFATADALPEIVDGLRARGFELVTVSQLLRTGTGPGEAVALPAPAARRAPARRPAAATGTRS